MKKQKTRLIAIILCVCMILNMNTNPGSTVFASVTSSNAVTYRYYDSYTEQLKTSTLEANTYNVVDTTASWDSAQNNGWYVVDDDITITNRVIVTGDVKLVLTDGHILTCSGGIEVAGENSLTIYGQENDTGTLIATASADQGEYEMPNALSGIGTHEGKIGSITIDGGTINATGDGCQVYGGISGSGYAGAGIGGVILYNYGELTEEGNITINGGNINAIGGEVWVSGGTMIASGISSVISTGAAGSAIVRATSIADTTGSESWSGIFFNGKTGTVYNTPVLSKDFTVGEGEELIIADGSTLNVLETEKITNNGTITISYGGSLSAANFTNNNTFNVDESGNVFVTGTLINTNVMNVNGVVSCDAINNSKLIAISETGTLACIGGTNTGMINNKGKLDNRGIISGDGGVIVSDTDVAGADGQLLRNVNYINEQGELTPIPSEDVIHPVTATDTIWQKDDGKTTWYVVVQDTTVGGISMADDINLLLLDGVTLTVNGRNDNGGINAAAHTLNIYAQSNGSQMGKLIATSGHDNWMAIGGSNATVNICGGMIDTTDSNAKSGIGCGVYQNCNEITITGGLIKTSSIGYKDAAVGTNTAGLYAPENSNAIIYTQQTQLGADTANTFHGILFLKENGTVYGNQELSMDLTVEDGEILTIPEGTTLTIPENITLTVKGELIVNGTLNNNGNIVNNATITNNAKLFMGENATLTGNEIAGTGKVMKIIDTVAVSDIDAPVAGVALDCSAIVGDETKYSATVRYYVDNTEVTDMNAEYETTYTAKVTVTPKDGYGFLDIPAATFNGKTPASTTLNDDETVTVAFIFTTTAPMLAPTITTQPADATVVVGNTATFTVASTGTPELTYQWQVNKGTEWEDISGATSASYTTSATVIGNTGYKYRCVVTNRKASVASNEATLTVRKLKLISITLPTAITGVANGTDKTETALGLPSTVTISTEDSTITAANVSWDMTNLAGGSYDKAVLTEQTFTVKGTVELPDTVDADGKELTVTIQVTVDAAPFVGNVSVSPAAGSYTENQSVTLTTATADAEIYYTTDGSTPSRTNGTKYTGAVSVTGTEGSEVTTIIKAVAVKDGMQDSEVTSFEYKIEIPDTTAPTAGITVGKNKWNSFLNTVTFGAFFKNTKEVTITGGDAQTGVSKLQYYLSDAELTLDEAKALTETEWTAYTRAFTINKGSKKIIYAKVTDKAGNFVIVNSNGIVVYEDSAQDTVEITHIIGVDKDQTAKVMLNGNTVKAITMSAGTASERVLTAGTDYTVTADGTITFKESYLESLAVSDTAYTVTISYNPMGETFVAGGDNEAPAATTLSIYAVNEEKGPSIVGDSETIGWDAIKDKTANATEGTTIIVDMNGTTEVPGAVIDSIKGKDVNVVFDLGGGIKWTINGQSVIKDGIGEIDFGVTTGTNTIPVDVVNEVTGERYSIQISLACNGEFGFTATLSINMDAKNAGYYANLYYYNKSAGKLEFMNAGKIDSDGNVQLTFTHASDYTIVISDKAMNESETTTPETTPTDTDLPKSGDNSSILLWVLVMLGSGLGIAGVTYKRRTRNAR